MKNINTITLANTTYQNNTDITDVDLALVPWTNNSMEQAFVNCSNLESVTNVNENVTNMSHTFSWCRKLIEAPAIPNGVTNLSSTFSDCNALENSPEIPNGVTDISGIFSGCFNMTNFPTLPNGITNMAWAFAECENLVNIPVIPNTVTNMAGAFESCDNISNVPVIPDGVLDLTETFGSCYNITNAPVIPNSVTNMAMTYRWSGLVNSSDISINVTNMNQTFYGCSRLTGDINILSNKITDAEECFYDTSLTKNVYMPFYYDNSVKTQTYNTFINAGYSATNRVNGALLMDPRVKDWRYDILANDTRLLYEYLGSETNVVVPNVVTMINNYTSGTNTAEANTPFYKNEDVINADLTYTPWENDSMAYAFYQARNVYSVRNINTNVTNYHRAFSGCINLFEISLPPTIYEVESVDMQYAFQDCVNLTYINAPVSIFYNTSNTVGIFDGCTNLSVINITGEYIPGAPTTTNVSRAFAGTAITVIPAMPGTIEDLSWTFENCHHLVNTNALPNGGVNMQGTFYNCSNLTEFKNITSTHLDDMSWTFYNCVNLTTAGTISNTATNMYQTFYNCSNLTSLPEIPTNVSNISGAFYNCALVNSVSTIPANVTDIAETFDGCSNLTGDINIESEIITNAGYSTSTRVNGVKLYDMNSEDIDLSDYDYTIDADNNVILTNYKGTATDIVTPHLSN